MSAGFTWLFSRMAFRPRTTASHQSWGFCSAQPGLGVYSGYSWVEEATTVPSLSAMMHFAPDVPTSSPIRYFLLMGIDFLSIMYCVFQYRFFCPFSILY